MLSLLKFLQIPKNVPRFREKVPYTNINSEIVISPVLYRIKPKILSIRQAFT